MSLTTLDTNFAGRAGPLFWLSVRTGVLTVLTLGIYRFWMKTRLRRYYWSSVRPGGHPLEYVGDPLEKLLGFLIAVVILAFYIGIVNLVLMFVSFSVFQTNTFAYALSLLGVIPIWFYALYRARRYVLARTRWRGIRFALEPGAWGYAWRAMVHWILTICTLGLLWPRMTFWLEKYKTDRTFFGDIRLEQGGSWTMLIRAAVHVIAPLLLTAAVGIMASTGDLRFLWALLILIPWSLYGLVHYSVESTRLLTNAKRAGDIRFEARPRPWRVLYISVSGYLIVMIVLSVVFTAVSIGTVAVLMGNLEALAEGVALPDMDRPVVVILVACSYFLVFVLFAALRHVFITQRLWRHYAETLQIVGSPALADIGQRDRDAHREAEGFAEALDLGAAI